MTDLTPLVRTDKALEIMLKAAFDDELKDEPRDDLPDIFHIGTWFPADVSMRVPYVKIAVVGGPTDRFGTDPTVDIDVWHSTKDLALSLDSRISAYLLGYPRSVRVDTRLVVLDTVFQTSGPVERPWDASDIRRIASTYQFSIRR